MVFTSICGWSGIPTRGPGGREGEGGGHHMLYLYINLLKPKVNEVTALGFEQLVSQNVGLARQRHACLPFVCREPDSGVFDFMQTRIAGNLY